MCYVAYSPFPVHASRCPPDFRNMNTRRSPIPHSVVMISLIFAIAAASVAVLVIPAFEDAIGSGAFANDVMFVSLGIMMIGFPLWLSIGLWRLSSDARIATLCFCWVAFMSIPFGAIASFSLNPWKSLAVGIAQFALVLWIYRRLVHPDIRVLFLIDCTQRRHGE